MKNMDAMVIAVIRQQLRKGRRPARDVVLAFVADEEAGSDYGARWLVDTHPDLFEGVTEAIGEVGGFSTMVAGQRLYLLQTAEKGLAWLRLTARGTAGHGSMIHQDNAITELAGAVARIGRHRWPAVLTPTVSAFLTRVCEVIGIDAGPENWDEVMRQLGPVAKMTTATLTNTANPTMLSAGYKVNVVPQTAAAHVDGRFLPGHEADFFAEIDKLLGSAVSREIEHYEPAVETTFDGDLCAAMTAALLTHDPGARFAPYCVSGATDAKSFSALGIRCFGFAPLRLPADLDFASMFHGVDEHVPIESLQFGVRVLDEFLTNC
jgi:acetylornithine deacetylase/succinyl-diaminopimelate desuccinylase-like protein